MLTLLVLQGPDKGQRFELADASILVGRESRALPLSDNTVSRRHCQIDLKEGVCLLTDLGSANGTFLNGLKVGQPQSVRVGDQLRVGRTLMVFGSLRGAVTRDGRVEMARGLDGIEGSEESSWTDASIVHTVGANDDSMVLAVPEASAAAMSNLQILYQLGAALGGGTSFDVEQAMAITLDLIFEHFKAERGVIMLKTEATGELETVAVRNREAAKSPPAAGTSVSPGVAPVPVKAPRTILSHVMTRGEGVLSSNAMADRRFAKGKSVQDMGVRSAVCVPIKARNFAVGGIGRATADATAQPPEVLGVIYIDSSVLNYTYSPDQLHLLSAIGLQAGMAAQNAKLYQAGVQAERLAAIGETTAALSHSIKNILQALRGGADVVEMGLQAANLSQTGKGWGIVNRNLDKIFSLTLNLLAYSRPRTPQLDPVWPGKVIGDCVELVATAASERGIMVVADLDSAHPPVPMDPDGMHQVVMNLLGNAIDAVDSRADKSGAGLVRVVSRYDDQTDQAVIEVHDNGPGVAASMRPHLFELFHSTKGNRGTGLGLAVSKKIIEEHDGTVEVEGAITAPEAAGEPQNGPRSGTTGTIFRIRLPMRPIAEAGDSWGSDAPSPT